MNANVIPLHNAADNYIQHKAVVMSVSDNGYMIDSADGVRKAEKAFSCLVLPQSGDVVLVGQSTNECHILAVLARPEEQDMTLSFPADVSMQSQGGSVEISGADTISMSSTNATRLLSPHMSMASAELDIVSGSLKATAATIETKADVLKLNSNVVNIIAKQVSQTAENIMRWVEGVETLNIGNLIQNVRNNYTSHSRQVVMTASEDVRVDGKRIHMG